MRKMKDTSMSENVSYKAQPKPEWKPGPMYYTAVYWPRRGRRGSTVKDEDGNPQQFITEAVANMAAEAAWRESQDLIDAGEFTGSDGR